MKGGPLFVIAAGLATASYFIVQRFEVVWPWEILKWSNAGLLAGTAAVAVGWLGWGAMSVGWLNKRRQLGPGR